MGPLVLDERTHDDLRLVAVAWGMREPEAVGELIRRMRAGADSERELRVPIYVVYKGQRIDAVFDRSSGAVEIASGPLSGQAFEKPSPAARAVVGLIDPGVNPHRNGWGFWLVTSTGQPLQSIRGS